jgi:hypothetical protein
MVVMRRTSRIDSGVGGAEAAWGRASPVASDCAAVLIVVEFFSGFVSRKDADSLTKIQGWMVPGEERFSTEAQAGMGMPLLREVGRLDAPLSKSYQERKKCVRVMNLLHLCVRGEQVGLLLFLPWSLQ